MVTTGSVYWHTGSVYWSYTDTCHVSMYWGLFGKAAG